MDKELEEKLRSFESIVLNEAKEKGEQRLDEIEKETSKALEKKETEYLAEAYEEIQEKMRKIRRSYNEQVLHAEVEARRELLKAREDIVESVFEECANRLLSFKASEKYKPWLCRKIDKGVSELGSGRITLALSDSDSVLEGELKSLYPDFEISYEDNGALSGGVKLYNSDRHTAVDYTLKTLLDAQRSVFLQTGGLAIN